MGFNNSSSASPDARNETAKRVDAAVSYIRQGRYAQAYLLLSEPGAEREPAARFALGLCLLRAEKYSDAALSFESALSLFKALPRGPASAAENTDIYIKLSSGEVNCDIYLSPIDTDFCLRFAKTAEQTVILALIYVYRKLGADEKARQLLPGLTGAAFEEYKGAY